MKRTRSLSVLVGAAGLAFTLGHAPGATAADLSIPVYEPPPMVAPVPVWTGCYIGVTIGYGSGDAPVEFPYSDNSTSPNGPHGGPTIGCNYQTGPLVLGIEADAAISNMTDSSSYPAGVGVTATNSTKIDYFGTLRGRFGVAFDNILLYGTGGLAVGHLSNTLSTNFFAGQTVSNTHVGWTAGGGAEVALGQHWSLKAEYLYLDLGSRDYTYGAPLTPQTHTMDVTAHLGRIGLNYRF